MSMAYDKTCVVVYAVVALAIVIGYSCNSRAVELDFGAYPPPPGITTNAPGTPAPPMRPVTLGDQARALREGRTPPVNRMAPARAKIVRKRIVARSGSSATLEITRADGSTETHQARYITAARPTRALQARSDAALLREARALAAEVAPGLAPVEALRNLKPRPLVDPLSAAAGALVGALAGAAGKKHAQRSTK